MEQIEKKWHVQQIGGVFRLVAGSWRRLHALKKKSKGYSKALQKTTHSLMKHLIPSCTPERRSPKATARPCRRLPEAGHE